MIVEATSVKLPSNHRWTERAPPARAKPMSAKPINDVSANSHHATPAVKIGAGQ
jgi:hypothetical protein